MNQLIPIKSLNDILPEYQKTPIESLVKYHNLKEPFVEYNNPELVIGTCMDSRILLQTPNNFAFIIRAGGANMQYSDFNISFAISVRQIKHLALIGHSDCGMVNIKARKDQIINGLVEFAGWKKENAKDHFSQSLDKFEINNEISFILSQTKRLRSQYPKIKIVPMMYLVEDNEIYFIKED